MMSSKKEEERNEKIVRGLMKLPPNRRCINCNSLGPQYVCTSFWTFICTTCSGIHREFTHRVKSVSMAKFTSQEVDALQKGGNQRARELFLKAWDPQRNILPDNSNAEKVREFIKNVYVNKVYSSEKSSDRPPRDPQSLRSHEDEMRRASSYHSYSQSPPYDFQYEERRYGKNAPALTRKPGSDRGLYEGKLASFLSPSHLSDDGFANEGSHPRVSDYSVSGGGDPFRSNALSPDSQRDIRSPSGEISGDISIEVPQLHTVQHDSDANVRSNGERTLHPQRTTSSGSFGSIDSSSMSFKSENSVGLPELGNKSEHSDGISLEKSLSYPSLLQSSKSKTFGGSNLFSTPFAQNAYDTPLDGSNSPLLSQPVSVDPLSTISSVSPFSDQRHSQIPQPPPLDMFAALSLQLPLASSNEKPSDAVTPNDGGWATFDLPQNVAPTVTENPDNGIVPSSDRNFNPFAVDHSPYQDFMDHEPFAATHAFGYESVQIADATIKDSEHWNAFEDSTGGQLNPNLLQSSERAAVLFGSNDDKSLGAYEAATSVGDAGVFSFATDHKPTNPFDMPFESDIDSSNTSQLWDMDSWQAALPDSPIPAAPNVGASEPWDPQNIYVGGVPFDSTTASVGHMSGQAPYTHIPNAHHGQGPIAFVGGNAFA